MLQHEHIHVIVQCTCTVIYTLKCGIDADRICFGDLGFRVAPKARALGQLAPRNLNPVSKNTRLALKIFCNVSAVNGGRLWRHIIKPDHLTMQCDVYRHM